MAPISRRGRERALPARVQAVVGGLIVLVSTTTGADLRFEGLDDRQTTNARAFVELADAPCETPEWQRERLIARAPEQIAEALEALGHYNARVDQPRVDERGDCWRVTFPVEPGPRAVFDRVVVDVTGDGADDPAFRRLLAGTPLKLDATLDHGIYESYKRSLTTTAAERGYFEARFVDNSVVVNEQGDRASVDLVLDTGPRYRFGEVRLAADFLEPRLLARFNDIDAGDWYDTTALTATHRALLDTGYFQYVNVNADPDAAVDRVVPVVIDLAPGKKRVYSGGLGFATDSGPRFRLDYRNRLINRRGHNLASELLLSNVQSLLGAEYRIPVGDNRRDIVQFRAGIENEDTDTSETRAIEIGARYARARGKHWLETVFLEAKFDDFEVGTEDSSSRLIVPGINWWYLSAVTRPQVLGRSLFFELNGTTELIGSDTSYLQAIARLKQISPLGERNRLLMRLDLAATAKQKLSELPPSARFFAGGDRSVRGYGFETIGALDSEGNVIGGGNLVAASVEVDRALNDRWGIALFADTGSAFNSGDPEFKTGVGIGLRRASPLGPIRIDLAHPLDLDRRLRLHISFGREL